ncbi:hypothetical protein [Methanolobus profundi]|uniref:Uncharacterized protein n=1 Tax=Methanolobus profundi TaxID=487685 RepID=A0A1I4REN5_9EURY|nr:hypothetical protein [Methanolobus profundi]SFM50689.1 hypothetical protein SAMN04488696_1531 [Methanolobus profundi]
MKNDGQEIIRVDIPKDQSLLMILIIPMIIVYFFLIAGIFSPTFEILAYLLWYLSIVILILQDRTTLNVTNGKIIIRRRFFDHVSLDIKEIRNVRTRNINPMLRVVVYLCIIGVIGYYGNDVLRSIQTYQTLHAPLEATAGLVISKITLAVYFYAAILSRAERRMKHSTCVEARTENGKFVFYPDRPEEFEKSLTYQVNTINLGSS